VDVAFLPRPYSPVMERPGKILREAESARLGQREGRGSGSGRQLQEAGAGQGKRHHVR
jgi:hypothetical protein